MPKKKIIHPVLGEIDPDEGPSVLRDEITLTPDKPIPPAFSSPFIESDPLTRKPIITPKRESFRKQLKRKLINLVRDALDRIDDDKK